MCMCYALEFESKGTSIWFHGWVITIRLKSMDTDAKEKEKEMRTNEKGYSKDKQSHDILEKEMAKLREDMEKIGYQEGLMENLQEKKWNHYNVHVTVQSSLFMFLQVYFHIRYLYVFFLKRISVLVWTTNSDSTLILIKVTRQDYCHRIKNRAVIFFCKCIHMYLMPAVCFSYCTCTSWFSNVHVHRPSSKKNNKLYRLFVCV